MGAPKYDDGGLRSCELEVYHKAHGKEANLYTQTCAYHVLKRTYGKIKRLKI